mmetsp:Transcript_90523/g.235746  ORF Transcript_90523/g.235746 Transcript_90523/m.235746 type:complete len:371 (+) Transcript_90523:1055-2167(+)
MRDDSEQRGVDLPSLLDVARLQLLEKSVVDPQIDVPLPVPLLEHRRLVRNGPLVHLPDLPHVAAALLQAGVVEPNIVVPRVILDTLLIYVSPLVEHHLLDGVAVAVLLLEGDIGTIKLVAGSLGKHVQGQLVDRLGTLHLLLALLELRELHVELLIKLAPEKLNALLEARTRAVDVAVLFLELGEALERHLRRVHVDVVLHHLPPLLDLLAPLLELDVLHPRVVFGLPLHPALKDGPRPSVVAEQLLHVGVLVPELVHPGQELADPVEQVPRVVHEFVLHLHLQILQPQADILVLYVERALEDGAGPAELLLGRLPLRVLDPGPYVLALPPDLVFELLPLADLVHLQLVLVGDALPRGFGVLLLAVHGLP